MTEQICRRHTKPPHRYETWLKRAMARWLRREARRDPENAPKKRRYSGYSD